MRLLALADGPNHVCYRYRIEAFAGAWPSAAGSSLRCALLGHAGAAPPIAFCADADVVILQRKLLPLGNCACCAKPPGS